MQQKLLVHTILLYAALGSKGSNYVRASEGRDTCHALRGAPLVLLVPKARLFLSCHHRPARHPKSKRYENQTAVYALPSRIRPRREI